MSRKKMIDELMLQLQMTSTNTVMLSQTIAEKLGITPTDLESLEALSRKGYMTAGKLSDTTGLTTGAVTGVIDRLEKRGFVKRESDPKDRRKVIVVLDMKKVKKEVLPLYSSLVRSVEKLLEQYPDNELELFTSFLKESHEIALGVIHKLKRQ